MTPPNRNDCSTVKKEFSWDPREASLETEKKKKKKKKKDLLSPMCGKLSDKEVI